MKFACFSLDMRRFPLERAFQMASRHGFQGLEIWGGRPHAFPRDMDAAAIKGILQLKNTYGLEIPMYTPDALNSPYNLCALGQRQRQDTLDYFKKAVEACGQMEVPRMLITADHPGYETDAGEAYRCFVENLRELGGEAERRGVILVLESLTPMESPVITTADHLVKAIRDIGLDNIEVMLDVVPPHIAYEPYSSYFTKLAGRMHYIHLCNNDDRTDAHLRLDGGSLPIADMLRLFRQYDFDGYVTMELYSEGFSDPDLLLANSARILSGICRELGIETNWAK